ncbi:hypothetical protein C5167_032880 [Papaver somniferum]|uniref:Uncharacterized protein n=1 Tax=Papaver somniferum TaxID=3469 RepID=A0A4Y7K8S4_PAPSO|nr:hypothetical protein C5167_032880 [Papaver somniferum]
MNQLRMLWKGVKWMMKITMKMMLLRGIVQIWLHEPMISRQFLGLVGGGDMCQWRVKAVLVIGANGKKGGTSWASSSSFSEGGKDPCKMKRQDDQMSKSDV